MDPETLAPHIVANADNGLPLLKQSRGWFTAIQAALPTEQSILYALANQSLDPATAACPGYAHIGNLRVRYKCSEKLWKEDK